jgi:hypothetical protein
MIIGASDSMLTAGDIQFEPSSVLKIQAFTNFAFMMTAGDAGLTAELVQDTGRQVRERVAAEPTNFWIIKDIADLYILNYNDAKLKRSEAHILAPLNLDRNKFLSEQAGLQEKFVDDIRKELVNFEMPTTACIVAGIDPTGSHIYTVIDDKYTCEDSVGFAAVGTGARHALSQLMLSGQSYMSSVEDTMLSLYIAKRRSEIAPGVGKVTQMVSVGPDHGFGPMPDVLMQKLDEEYQRIVGAEREVFAKAQGEVKRYVEELAKQAARSGPGDLAQTVPNGNG